MDTTQTNPSFYDPNAAVRRLAAEAQVDALETKVGAVRQDTWALRTDVEVLKARAESDRANTEAIRKAVDKLETRSIGTNIPMTKIDRGLWALLGASLMLAALVILKLIFVGLFR